MTNSKNVTPLNNESKIIAKQKFNRSVIKKNALTTSNIMVKDFDRNYAEHKTSDALMALDAENGLQSMLAAQMLSVHELQQRAMIYAHSADDFDVKKFYIHAAVKLANCFTQQTNTLAKIQGVGGQKIIVEHVDVHSGGQAIVGNIHRGATDNKGKKDKI